MSFKVGDKVKAKGHPFWLTIKSALAGGNRFTCTFGTSGRDAGVWFSNELEPYLEIAVAPEAAVALNDAASWIQDALKCLSKPRLGAADARDSIRFAQRELAKAERLLL